MFWFQRMTEHWTLPQRLDLVEHTRRARLQVVQVGTFGPQFYGLADDPTVDREWVGMPLLGVAANLELAAKLVPRLREAGARVIGQMSMSWHYGDHLQGKGLFGAWQQLWEEHLGETAPCADPVRAQQQVTDGRPRSWSIEGRPYRAYSGCMCNPLWLTTLKAMLKRAIALGVDGVNVHHNFERPCACAHCRKYLSTWLGARFTAEELRTLLGTDALMAVDARTPDENAPEALRRRYVTELERAAHYRRKAAFDEVFIHYGRALKPDLLLGQWYHKYDFNPTDERSLLPPELWARDEDFIWYSQGGAKGCSALSQGYLADMGLPARFVHAAGEGRPFIINKYDYRRWRLSIAEAAAHHAAAPAFHWSQDGDAAFALEDYRGPVYRYQRFLADHETLIHPARPWSQIGLVYPRRGEIAGDPTCTQALRRLGRLLEDTHALFDMLMDHQITSRARDYDLLILPRITRLSDGEIQVLRAFLDAGGKLICTDTTGRCDEQGRERAQALLPTQRNVIWMDAVPCHLEQAEIRPGIRVPVCPALADDAFGRTFLTQVRDLLGAQWLTTDAPWYVRVRAWRPEGDNALVLHWVNYHQDEDAAIEVPWPEGPITVQCALPPDFDVERVDWLYPEMEGPRVLEHAQQDGRVTFVIPQVIVYGLSVLRPVATD